MFPTHRQAYPLYLTEPTKTNTDTVGHNHVITSWRRGGHWRNPIHIEVV